MIKNAFATLMISRGTPMFFMGDEFGNSQGGNNNAYCQDNNISWLNWDDLKTNKKLFDFFKYMIKFRKEHDCIRKKCRRGAFGYPEMSSHGTKPWDGNYADDAHYIGVMFAGENEKTQATQAVYLAINSYWEPLIVRLPALPSESGYSWRRVVDTYERDPMAGWMDDEMEEMETGKKHSDEYRIMERSVIVFEAVKR
jgi:glycogen operon protein